MQQQMEEPVFGVLISRSEGVVLTHQLFAVCW